MYVGELIYFTALALIKWSILAMYYRLFPTRFMKWGYIVLGSMTGLWWIAVMLVTIFQCNPVHRFWDLATPGTCVNANVFYISTNGVPNIVMDAMILSLPIYEVYKLHVALKIKVAIVANFLIGALVIIASIVKLKVMVDLYYMGPTADITCTYTIRLDSHRIRLTLLRRSLGPLDHLGRGRALCGLDFGLPSDPTSDPDIHPANRSVEQRWVRRCREAWKAVSDHVWTRQCAAATKCPHNNNNKNNNNNSNNSKERGN